MDNLEELLNQTLSSDRILASLKQNWDKYHNIDYIGDFIGEVYLLYMICKDGFGFDYYMTKMDELYHKYYDRQISPEDFNLEKAKTISIVIANKIGIDINQEITQGDKNKIKDYFLREYVENGYVAHSFPDAYKQFINENGLVGIIDEKKDKPRDIVEIQKIFMSKGIATPLGGYPYYDGAGVYFEHDFSKVFMHSIDSPEWFKWFTSSDHTTAHHSNIETSPYVLREEKYCRRNIEDLCQNAELSSEEELKVLKFYQESYEKFKSSKLNVALISKKFLGKNMISEAVPANLDLFDTIKFVLRDGALQYVEHVGNVYSGIIPPSEVKITEIPPASEYLNAFNYLRETKEQVTDLQTNINLYKKILNHEGSLTFEMRKNVIEADEQLENMFVEKNSQNAKTQDNSNSKMFK